MVRAEATDVVLFYLDGLSSEDDSVREGALQELNSLGAAAIPGLLDAIEQAVSAEGAARAIQWVRLRKTTAVIPAVIGLAWCAATGAVMFGASGAVVAALGAPVVIASFLGMSWLRSRTIERAARRGACAREVLKTITDVQAINFLAERLSRGHRIISSNAAWAVERLLPGVSADDWNSALTTAAKRKLGQVLAFSNADAHPILLVAILKAMARSGDTRVYYDITTIAGVNPTTAAERLVVAAAREYISEIEHSAGRQRDKSVLLRATDSPPSELLRPAASTGCDETELLRPAVQDNPHTL